MLKENIYKEALQDIAKASDQANPIQLRTVAQIALDSEPTTADEYNKKIFDNDMKEMEEAGLLTIVEIPNPTTDEFNVPVITGDKDSDALLEDERINQDEGLRSQQKALDDYRDTQSEIAKYDKKFSEAAESTWRNTVLHPDYKSPVDEEE